MQAANANPNDPYFPVSRAFDWFHGHSWAKGLFESADGKDEESTSEDAYFSYALKLWGAVTGDKPLERRGDLMLAIERRTFNEYFLLQSNNINQPAQFIANKVTGIVSTIHISVIFILKYFTIARWDKRWLQLFENKVDHTTYFGNDIRFIQGIHMIPVSPISYYIRPSNFIREEWLRYFSEDGKTGDDGWKGILYSNYALIEPTKALAFFSSNSFKKEWLDGGASRTWYLALCIMFQRYALQ
jgi:endo-1,3(4)-beta-glucanase